ncbi:uncharacterized protein LOC143225338 [Tachypleus tridentatus]|uniref:uncharacterized protein LOC143225338 n=1 Tax=Tachypleus tridentatus TaxID=6853 RepID=UPI003FD64229
MMWICFQKVPVTFSLVPNNPALDTFRCVLPYPGLFDGVIAITRHQFEQDTEQRVFDQPLET